MREVGEVLLVLITAHEIAAAGAALYQINEGIPGGPEKIGLGITGCWAGVPGELDEKILKEIPGVGFRSGQAEEKSIQRRCMGIVESGEGFGRHTRSGSI